MSAWLSVRRLIEKLLWAILAMAAIESLLLAYYLNSWLTLPLL